MKVRLLKKQTSQYPGVSFTKAFLKFTDEDDSLVEWSERVRTPTVRGIADALDRLSAYDIHCRLKVVIDQHGVLESGDIWLPWDADSSDRYYVDQLVQELEAQCHALCFQTKSKEIVPYGSKLTFALSKGKQPPIVFSAPDIVPTAELRVSKH